MARRFDIVDGPSKWNFAVSLFDGGSRGRRVVSFALKSSDSQTPFPLCFLINGAEREDGSGENWLFKGYSCSDAAKMVCAGRGFFSLQTRKGRIELEDSK